MKTKIFLTLIAILFISSLGCERVKQVITPDAPSTDTTSIKIGVIQPSGLAPNFTRGAELARTQVNNAGGLLGMQIEFVIMDNQGNREFPDAAESVRIAKALIQEEGVVAILGPLLSTNSMQVGPVVTELRRPIITGSSGEKVTSTGEFVFITVAPSSVQGATTAQFALDPTELNAKTAATIRQAGDVYSNAVADAFEANFQKLGGTLVASEVYQHGDRDFAAQLEKIKAAAPDVLLIAGFSPEIPLVALQVRNMGIDATFIGTNGWDEPDKLLGTLDDNTPLEGSTSPEVLMLNLRVQLPLLKRTPRCLWNRQTVPQHGAMMLWHSSHLPSKTLERWNLMQFEMPWRTQPTIKARPLSPVLMRIVIP